MWNCTALRPHCLSRRFSGRGSWTTRCWRGTAKLRRADITGKVTAESTPLFALVDGARVPIHRANGGFKIQKKQVALDELLRQIADHPEAFNANGLLRPGMQEHWLADPACLR